MKLYLGYSWVWHFSFTPSLIPSLLFVYVCPGVLGIPHYSALPGLDVFFFFFSFLGTVTGGSIRRDASANGLA